MDILFGNQPRPGESNQYDDDYASDYGDEQTAIVIEKQTESVLKPVTAINDAEDEDLLALLSTSHKSPEKPGNANLPGAAMYLAETQKLDEDPDFSILLGKTKPPEKLSSHDDLKARSGMVLNKLKKLPREYLEAKPGGITKVIAKGLKNTQLTLKDCVSVLKAAAVDPGGGP